MPFRLSNTGSVYSRMLDLALEYLPVEYWLSYLDNILVYSMDTWDHLKHLRSIGGPHEGRDQDPTKKTKIFQTETEHLGHKVSQGGVQMLDQYVMDIQNWPRSTSFKEMSSFLGFTVFYRGFIPVFKICHEGVAAGHKGMAGTLDKFQRTFFIMSACEKIRTV